MYIIYRVSVQSKTSMRKMTELFGFLIGIESLIYRESEISRVDFTNIYKVN